MGTNATAPHIIDGPTHIEGELTFVLYSGAENPGPTSISIKSLIKVTGTTTIRTQWPPADPVGTSLVVLDFPILGTLGLLMTSSVESLYLHTLNFPNLEHAKSIWLHGLEKLHTINAPNIQSLGALSLSGLSSLTRASCLAAALEGHVSNVKIGGMALTEISFPNIGSNKNLTIAALPSLTLITKIYGAGGGDIYVENNNPNL